MGMIGVFVGAMVGGCFGVVVTCLAVAAKRADEQDGIYEPGDKRARDPAENRRQDDPFYRSGGRSIVYHSRWGLRNSYVW